jgi:hypothetical protein
MLARNLYPLSLKLALLFVCSGLCLMSGCSSSAETTVIAPTENFQEDPSVAEEKAKAMAESQKEPL